MFDDLMDVFDRDRSQRSGSGRPQRGVRGLLSHLLGDHDDDHGRHTRSRRHDDGDEFDIDDDDFGSERSSRRRRRDHFDLDD
jgi:hypothetical protein